MNVSRQRRSKTRNSRKEAVCPLRQWIPVWRILAEDRSYKCSRKERKMGPKPLNSQNCKTSMWYVLGCRVERPEEAVSCS